jgi:hypothetical protein
VSEPILARLVPLDAPEAETELEFWRRKAAERAKDLYAVREQLHRLEMRILELIEEVGP